MAWLARYPPINLRSAASEDSRAGSVTNYRQGNADPDMNALALKHASEHPADRRRIFGEPPISLGEAATVLHPEKGCLRWNADSISPVTIPTVGLS